MKTLIFSFFLIFLNCSCKIICKNKENINSNIIKESELQILSKDCNYVDQLLKSRSTIIKSKEFPYDFRLVNVWKYSNCFSNYSFKEFKTVIGEPSESKIDANQHIYYYKFSKSDKSFAECTIVVINDSIVRNYCLDNVKITNLGDK